MKKLQFQKLEKIVNEASWAIILIKPLGSKLHRVFSIPKMSEEERTEVMQVLNTLCTTKHKDVWYFKLDEEMQQLTVDTFMEMGIVSYAISVDVQPELSN